MLLPKAGYKINIIIYSKKSIKEKPGRWLMDGDLSDISFIRFGFGDDDFLSITGYTVRT
jgi:hypothetical protein